MPVNDADPILRFQPDRTATWSKGWNFSIVNTIHSNNYGFICDFDYDRDVDSPLLAVIGDSYVEAVMVPFQETITGRLDLAGRLVPGRSMLSLPPDRPSASTWFTLNTPGTISGRPVSLW